MNRSFETRLGRVVILVAASMWLAPTGLIAEDAPRKAGTLIKRFIPPAGAKTHTVVLGERFRAGGFHKWFYGSDYRHLWNTPIEVDVIDLNTVGGGLTPVRTGGFGQSIALHFIGADGKRYTVRSVDKDPTKRIWGLLKETVVDDVLQDLISSQLPTGGVVVDPLMRAAGILHTSQRRVVIPDDPRLGEFREEFAGLVGTLQIHPGEGPDKTPGFAGSREVKGSEQLWDDLEKSPKHRVNQRAFLKARLMDVLINDKDRHHGQWRWARFPDGDGYTWHPIPEDRDQAFIDYDGFLMFLVRRAVPKQIKFEAEYPSLVGLTVNGWELDREYLSELEKSVWDSMVTAFQQELPDAVIEDAVKVLPPPFYEQAGDFLTNALKTRRDNLPEFADRFYRLITKQAEVRATDKDEYVLFEHKANGDLTLSIGLGGPEPSSRLPAYFRRTYRPSETREVRLYAHGGDDYIEVSGSNGRITILADGGGGDDTYVNTSQTGGGKTKFYDARGNNSYEKGKGADVNTRRYKRPPGLASTNTRRWLDWGSEAITLPVVTASPDLGVYGGVISGRQYYGYRRDPYSSKHLISLGVASDGVEPFIGYTGAYRHILSTVDGALRLSYSGINVIRFNGLGNNTQTPESSSFYKVEQKEFVFSPGLVFRAGNPPGISEELSESSPDAGFVTAPTVRTTFTLAIGPILKYSDTPLSGNEDKYIGSLATLPYVSRPYHVQDRRVRHWVPGAPGLERL